MLTYKKSDNLEVIGHLDLDFTRCVDFRKSTFGYLLLLAGRAISWIGAKRLIIVASTMKVKFMACFEAITQENWLQNFILGLGIVNSIAKLLKLYCKNSVVVFFSKKDK